MKNVFGIKKESEKDFEVNFDGSVFITATLNESQMSEIERLNENAEEFEKKVTLPLPLTILKHIFWMLGLIVVVAIIRSDVNIQEGFSNAPYLYIGAPIALGISLILEIFERIKTKKVIKSDDFNSYLDQNISAAKKSMELLNIPTTAPSVDILSSYYKIKKDKTVSAASFDYLPLDVYAYADEKYLHLADSTTVFSFCRSDIVSIKKIEKKASLGTWNKDESIKSERYKPYKMTENNLGFVMIKNYYALRLHANFGEYEILIPPYEIDTVTSMLGIKIANENP